MEVQPQSDSSGSEGSSDSLEGPSTVVESPNKASQLSGGVSNLAVQPDPTSNSGKKSPTSPVKKLPLLLRVRARLNIYLVMFIVIVLAIVGGIIYAVSSTGKPTSQSTVNSQTLTPAELSQLAGSSTTIGSSNQNLTIQSNATFSGAVLVKSDLSVAGTLKVGGSLNLPGISVTGTSTFDTIQASSLTVSGTVITQGALTVQKSLTVSSSGNFGGALSAPQIVTQNLQLQSDLQLSHHIDTIGATPSRSDDSALGSGGTSSVSGTDTAGIVDVNTGGSPSSGCFITLTFAQPFGTTPHVVLTPTNSAAASLQYYVTPSAGNFSVCGVNPTSGQSYSFDYIVID